ncbi:hypothetical protein BASA81_003910 [Batrachochytrium salamandrivorans]|nr:hypothetical protein BASA81_003910 [Batrachochytrium salamandrivorans]
MFVLRQRFLGWRNLSSRVLLPTIPASEAKDMGIKWDEANFVHFVEQDQMVEALQKYAMVKTPAGNYRDTKTKLNVPFADREAVKAKNARFDSETLSWYAPAGVDLNEFNVWLKEPKKVYLQVPYAEKDEAKLLGAQFDRVTSKWYLDASRQDRAIFSKWAEWDPNAPPNASSTAAKPLTPLAQKHFLHVPFADKDEAKQLGGWFDREFKLWYFDQSVHSREEFAKWPSAVPGTSAGVPTTATGFSVVDEDDRVFMDVPFAEKDEAKGLGARFDPAKRKWYYDRTKHTPTEFAKWKALEREHEDH